MISLCYGYKPCPIWMSSTSKYYPESLVNEAEKHLRINQEITLKVGEKHFPVSNDGELMLAANVVASYHNQYVTQDGCDTYHTVEE